MLNLLILSCQSTKDFNPPESSDLPQDTSAFQEPSSEPSSDEPSSEDSSEPEDPPPQDLDGDGFVDGEDCDDQDSDRQPQLELWTLPPQRCGSGQLVGSIDGAGDWNSDLGISLTTSTGCNDYALELSWSLESQTEHQASYLLPSLVDLSTKPFLSIPLRHTAQNGSSSLTLSFEDELECLTQFEFEDIPILSAWRPILLSKEQFSTECSFDWSKVAKITITLSNNSDSVALGTVLIDDISAVSSADYGLEMAAHFYCPPMGNNIGRGDLAASVLNHHHNHLQLNGTALLPSWMEEQPITYRSYDQALALILFSMEFRRTGNDVYANAATLLANHLLELPRSPSGGWYDAYNTSLEPVDSSALSASSIGWMNIAFHQYIASILPTEVMAYKEAVKQGAYLLQIKQASFGINNPDFNGLVGENSLDNIAAYFGFIAANRQHPQETFGYNATAISDLMLEHMWDEQEGRITSGLNNSSTQDVAGGWSTQFLRHLGERDKALRNNTFAAKMMSTSTLDEQLEGIASNGPWQPSWEHTGMYSAAGGPNLEVFLNNALTLSSGTLLPAHNDSLQELSQNSWHGIAPTAWIYFGFSGGFLDKM